MSLKRAERNFTSISRFLAALLRPFMSEPPSQLPYLFFQSPVGLTTATVVDWNSHMSQYLDEDGDNSYANCFLRHIDYCKCSQSVEHEFLVFHFSHWTGSSSAVGVVCVDRVVRNNQDLSSSGQSSGLTSPSSSDNLAYDAVSIIGSPRDAKVHLTERYGPFKTLCKLQFPSISRPSALQVSTILTLVNQHAIFYNLYDRQCYWYADTVWRSLKRLFPENEEVCTGHNVRSRFGPFPVGPSDQSVDAVCGHYESAWENTLGQLSQARDRRAAKQARLREEGRVKGLEEGRVKGVEEGRAERQREIEEMQAEIQRLRAEHTDSYPGRLPAQS